jgi:hypothetical protein
MGKLWKSLIDLLKGLIIEGIQSNLTNVFQEFDEQAELVNAFASATPDSFNHAAFTFIQTVTQTVIVPIAGIVITYVLVYELVSMVMERNNMHEFDTFFLFRYLGKAAIAVMVVSHTSEIVNAIFEVGGYLASQATTLITGSTRLNADYQVLAMLDTTAMEDMPLFELLGNLIETFIIMWAVRLMAFVVAIITLGRFMEIYLYMSVAPVPFSMFANKEWGNVGMNYLRGLFALALQGLLIVLCVGIYSALIQALVGKSYSDFSTICFCNCMYTAALTFALIKTGSLSKQIMSSH